MLIGRTEIASLIPHGGPMCLLNGVERWDEGTLRATATSHRDPQNPLRAGKGLAVLCGVEYAAQAMALHGRLAAPETARPRAGYLASLRNLRCSVERLDELGPRLIVDVEKLMGDGAHVIYRFSLGDGAIVALSGRAAVVLDAEAA